MGRIVTAVVTHGGACAGMVGPFPVEVPWWAQVEPVVTHLEETLGVPVVVLRLLADIPGTDCWDASPQVAAAAVHRLATAQSRISQPPQAIPDRRPETLAAAVDDLLDGQVGAELSLGELRAARSLRWRWEMLTDCGLPDTVVHGDFHPGT
jgi:Phosphotransferase enzyme family